MINHRVALTPEILEFFHLARDPFAAPRSPAELFTTPAIESVYAQLEQAVRFQGFVCLLAPVGAGKTMLKNRLIDAVSPKPQVQKVPSSGLKTDYGHMGPETWDLGLLGPGTWDLGPISMILSPRFVDFSRVTAAGIVAYVLEELGVKPRRALVLAQKQLEQRLAKLAQNNITVALCFDECHHLNDTLLTALKNFYELGTGGFERYLGLILFGQPQFAARLELPRFREIAERLACLELPAFSPSTAENYLMSILDFGFRISDFVDETAASEGSESECVSPHVSKGVRLNAADENPKSEIPNPKWLFEPAAVRLIAARASTPLGIANAAAAAMLEAYKKGERCVLARFVPGEENGPRTSRIAK